MPSHHYDDAKRINAIVLAFADAFLLQVCVLFNLRLGVRQQRAATPQNASKYLYFIKVVMQLLRYARPKARGSSTSLQIPLGLQEGTTARPSQDQRWVWACTVKARP